MTQLVKTLAQQVMQRCDNLAKFSESPDGLTRTFLSPPMHDTHKAITTWMETVGTSVQVDAVGNILGNYISKSNYVSKSNYISKSNHVSKSNYISKNMTAKTLLIGSHLDTVKNAGKYDGIIGVLLGLALVEYCVEENLQLPFNIKVIGFSEEEGIRYSMPFIGSKAITGTLKKTVLNRKDGNDITMRDAISAFGKNPDNLEQCKLNPDDILGFIEIHHEQSRQLDKLGKSLGIVSTIVGQSRAKLSFEGKAGHAGTEIMSDRKDALAAAAEFILAVEEIGQATEGLVATVGMCSVTPNAVNVIPALTELSLDVRHGNDKVRSESFARYKQKAEEIAKRRNIRLSWQSTEPQKAIDMDKQLSSIMQRAINLTIPDVPIMVSGAGHDAMVMAEFCPSCLLFIRDPLGLSHHPDETIDVKDVEVTIEALVNFVKELSSKLDSEVQVTDA